MTDSWCVVSIDGEQIKAKIVHRRGGKFEVVESEDGSHLGKVIDASAVDNCKRVL